MARWSQYSTLGVASGTSSTGHLAAACEQSALMSTPAVSAVVREFAQGAFLLKAELGKGSAEEE